MNLTALQHSPFLQSLGWAIANSLWQAAALWVAYYLINETYKKASARFKTNTAIILLSSAFVWFCFTLFSKYVSLHNKLIVDAVTQYYSPSKSASNVFSFLQWPLILNKLAAALPYLSVAYLLLLVFLSFRLLTCYRYTSFIKSNGLQKPSAEWKLFTERVALHIGITKKIKLWVSHHIDVPATIGFLKPVILIPVASINQLSAEQLEAIILHELSHIKRNDYLINIFISLVETILFFNPFIVLLAKIIKRERENCCDDFVIQYQYDRHSYASALLSLEQYRNINLRLAISATSGKKQLLHRVKRIMEAKNISTFNYGQKLLALLLITGIISSLAWLSPNHENKNVRQTSQVDKVALKELNVLKKIGTIISQQNNRKLKDVVVSLQQSITKNEAKELAVIQKKIKDKEIIIKPVLQEKQEVSNDDIVLHNVTIKAPKMEALFSPSEFKERTNTSNTLFLSKAATAAGGQRLQLARLQPTDFKTYDLDCIEADIKQAFLNVHRYFSADAEPFETIKKEQLQKLINKEIKNPRGRTYSRPQITPVFVKTLSSKSISLADSILSKKMVLINNRVRRTPTKTSERELITLEEGRQYLPTVRTTSAYSYTTATNIPVPNNGVSIGGTGMGGPKNPPAAPTIYVNGKASSQIKTGTIIIDGKVIKLPDTEKIVAQLKGKTFSIINGNEVIEIQMKD